MQIGGRNITESAFDRFYSISAANLLSYYISRLCQQNMLNANIIDANLLAISNQISCQSGICRTVCLLVKRLIKFQHILCFHFHWFMI